MQKMNPEQEQVAEHVHGRILTLAGPGSGKTRTPTERTGRLIRKGFRAASLLCLTFTNKARDEMRDRIGSAQGPAAAKVYISNFHGLCGVLLRRFGSVLGYTDRATVCDADDQVDLVMQVVRRRGLEPTKPQARAISMVANDWRENLGTPVDLEAATAGRLSDADGRRPPLPRGAARPRPVRLQRPALGNGAPPARPRRRPRATPLHPGGRVPGH